MGNVAGRLRGRFHMIRKIAAAFTASAIAFATPAAAKDCADLAGLKLENGKVTSAALVPAGAFEQPAAPFGPPPGVANAVYRDVPQFCRVQATLTPTADSDIKVEVWLPASGWNGKFVGIGNGIWAGQLSYSQLADPLKRGYAVATTDTGHAGSGLTAEWAKGHPEKLIDFGHRAVHLMAVTAKQAIGAFYGSGPKLSYWNSCSTGGRQGLMAAHRYPADFDAISAMAPANPMTALMVQSMWAGWQPKRWDGAALSPAKLAAVHAAAVRACDADDGLADGLIGRPLQCRFDPATIQCSGAESDSCLTAPQVAAMRNVYGGVRAPDGSQVLPGWPVGSEMQLALLFGGNEPFPVATSFFRDLVYGNRPGWDWKVGDYAAQLADARGFGASILDVPYDGLGAFFARGGKLLLSHGWTDGLIPATNTIAFYHGLYSALPAEAAQAQLRLFMAPGMDHCAGGEGPSSFDTLGTIDAWATTGTAPDRILATRAAPAGPNAPALPPMSRPLCPWPMVAMYDGEGDPNAAENFVCAMAEG